MSVLTIRQWQQFSAPVFIGTRSSLTGSWTRCQRVSPYEQAMAPNILFHLRLSTWRQQTPNGVTDACLDWCVHAEDGQLKHTVQLKVGMIDSDFADILVQTEFAALIQEKLNRSPIVKNIADALGSLQQAHPGDA